VASRCSESRARQSKTNRARNFADRIAPSSTLPTRRPHLHQAGAIPYAIIDGELRILLVTARGSGRWLIPKGNIDPGLTPAQAAAKEAYEEAGIRGKITTDTPLGFFTSFKGLKSEEKKKPVTVEVYALLVGRQLKRWPERKQREICWMSADDAANSVKEPGLTQLLLRLKEILESEEFSRLGVPSDGDVRFH